MAALLDFRCRLSFAARLDDPIRLSGVVTGCPLVCCASQSCLVLSVEERLLLLSATERY